MKTDKIIALQDFIRQPFAFPGGYAKVLVMGDGELMCRDCAKDNYRLISSETRWCRNNLSGWCVLGVEVYWEGADVNCCHCGCDIKSEYGDPECPEGWDKVEAD